MIIDTSAILAILFQESEASAFADLLERERTKRMSVANFVEAEIRLIRLQSPVPRLLLEQAIDTAKIALEPVTETQGRLAATAYRDYGRGRHPAALNLGDCFAYALAKDMREPLLYKGSDFSKTDIVAALS